MSLLRWCVVAARVAPITADEASAVLDLFYDRRSKEVRRFPPEIHRAARRKMLYIHDAAELADLRVPPGNWLEALKGDMKGHFSIRITDQWRVTFRWKDGNALDVSIVDYH